jgi:excisionase family DNA binding protein
VEAGRSALAGAREGRCGVSGETRGAGLAAALVDALDDAALERLLARLGPRLLELVAARLGDRGEDRWLSTREAAEYLGLTPNALHKLTAARVVPFSQEQAGGKLWFLRSELDAWRRGGG